MAQKTYNGVTVDVNEEGYFTNPSQWTKEIAVEIANDLQPGDMLITLGAGDVTKLGSVVLEELKKREGVLLED